jgi:hypothetical protein
MAAIAALLAVLSRTLHAMLGDKEGKRGARPDDRMMSDPRAAGGATSQAAGRDPALIAVRLPVRPVREVCGLLVTDG